ncbi:PRORP domain-containing protein [Caenorhabditis elegans]|uniref:PRORP domain-containing protein n=1 Tax=Caenorhabditis elegans TaxID=6239 RepID=Q23317_CAEEL|nr:PRORP domain-containing protein [Caenorhabditis elegans]CAB00061.1 PRORP domain-containing protein [Caenorhabditis elegans]|eukprot:NP_492713.1 Cytochrome Oxidase Assembly subunits [Caenorhabditis elegans]
MLSMIRSIRSISTTSSCLFPTLNSPFPRPEILEMSPKYQFLTTTTPQINGTTELQSMLSEVLRCNSFFDSTVFNNVVKMVESQNSFSRDFANLTAMRYIAVVYHSINDEEARLTLKRLKDNIEKCKIHKMQEEHDKFRMSLDQDAAIPDFSKVMHKQDLVRCYFRRELANKKWKTVKQLLSRYPKNIKLYEHISAFLDAAKLENAEPIDIMQVFMNYAQVDNPRFMEQTEFDEIFKQVAEACSAKVSVKSELDVKKTYISEKEGKILKEKCDKYVESMKEGFVKKEEYEKIRQKVLRWMEERNIRNGENVVVVDALNFGYGVDPKEWDDISSKFEHVFFATRRISNQKLRKEVMERYNGNALFCDKLSTDDLIIIRMALEFGPETSIVTNDKYTDHRSAICNGDQKLEKIFDDFLTDASHRHFHGRIETRRNFNIRIRNPDNRIWILPVMNSEGKLSRNIKRYKVEVFRNS